MASSSRVISLNPSSTLRLRLIASRVSAYKYIYLRSKFPNYFLYSCFFTFSSYC